MANSHGQASINNLKAQPIAHIRLYKHNSGWTSLNIMHMQNRIKSYESGHISMKKGKLLAFLAVLSLSLAGCKLERSSSQALEFRLSDHGTYYVGQGSSTSISSVVIPETYKGIIVDGIFDSGFRSSSYTSISIPDSVNYIGEGAFSYCTSLSSVIIPDGVTSIGDGTFSGCSSLSSVSIPGSVTSIGGWTFSGCSSLESITIPDSVTSIGECAFDYCSSLAEVFYVGSAADWSSITVGEGNDHLTSATRYFYSEEKPTESGNYWRYVDGVPTVW